MIWRWICKGIRLMMFFGVVKIEDYWRFWILVVIKFLVGLIEEDLNVL